MQQYFYRVLESKFWQPIYIEYTVFIKLLKYSEWLLWQHTLNEMTLRFRPVSVHFPHHVKAGNLTCIYFGVQKLLLIRCHKMLLFFKGGWHNIMLSTQSHVELSLMFTKPSLLCCISNRTLWIMAVHYIGLVFYSVKIKSSKKKVKIEKNRAK